MGLLDDAIREHLELRREHGADPDEVAREEDAALAPLRAGEKRETVEPAPDDDEMLAEGDEDHDPGAYSSHTVQETVEIDMRTVLEAEDDEDAEGDEIWEIAHDRGREGRAAPVAAGIEPPSSMPDAEEDPLEPPAKRGRLFKRRTAP